MRAIFQDRGILVLALVFLLTIPLLTPRVAASDEIEYFSYLHSIVFDHDLNFLDEYQHYCNLDYDNCVQSRFIETFIQDKTATGLQINFGPIGSALLWLPFYLVGHLVALAQGSADGYSAPYVYAISFASLLYGWIGIGFAYKLAREFVEEKIALGAALVVLFATNAVYYLYVAPAMSHANSLFASALFVFIWYRTRDSRAQGKWSRWVLLGACGALMTMVREQEAIFALIPIVETIFLAAKSKNQSFESLERSERELDSLKSQIPEVSDPQNLGSPKRSGGDEVEGTKRKGRSVGDEASGSTKDIKTNIFSLRSSGSLWFNLLSGLVAMFAAWFIAFTPQLLVYKILNGNFEPAKDVTQKFTFDGAHIGDILFSSLHGLFSWTPLTLFAVIGLFVWLWRARANPEIRLVPLAFIITFLAEVYLLGSFSTWFGGAAFGMRRFVNCTVLFVPGLALLVDELQKRISLKALMAVGALFVVWNLFFIVQFATGMIPRADAIDFAKFSYDQVFVVPSRLADILWRFIFARTSFFKQ